VHGWSGRFGRETGSRSPPQPMTGCSLRATCGLPETINGCIPRIYYVAVYSLQEHNDKRTFIGINVIPTYFERHNILYTYEEETAVRRAVKSDCGGSVG